MSTLSLLLGRSRTCPMDAFTSYPGPRYLPMVLALDGDSTITKSVLLATLDLPPEIDYFILRFVFRESGQNLCPDSFSCPRSRRERESQGYFLPEEHKSELGETSLGKGVFPLQAGAVITPAPPERRICGPAAPPRPPGPGAWLRRTAPAWRVFGSSPQSRLPQGGPSQRQSGWPAHRR